jgi:hypothetical protein
MKRAVIQYGLYRYAGSLGLPLARKNTPLTQKLSNSWLVMRFGCPTTVTPPTLSSSCCRFVIKSGRHRACNKVLQLSKCQRKCSCNYADARMHEVALVTDGSRRRLSRACNPAPHRADAEVALLHL